MDQAQHNRYGHEYDQDDALDMFAYELERTLSEAQSNKAVIEQRMVEDLRQYHGRYPDTLEAELKKQKRSRAFANITRYKCNAGESQMVDLLFPNDKKNWSIGPTPDPELIRDLGDTSPAVIGGTEYEDEEGNTITKSDIVARKIEMAQEAAKQHERVIEDQFVESDFAGVSRRAIHHGCVLGTGIIKGPVVKGKNRRSYQRMQGMEGFQPMLESRFVPTTHCVAPWDFFPDMSVSDIAEAEYTFERSYMSRTQIRRLVRTKGYMPERVAKVLQMEGRLTQHPSTYVDDIRRLTGLSDSLNDNRYELWEYRGPISWDVMVAAGMVDPEQEPDPLLERNAVVVYCGGVVLSVKMDLLDEDDSQVYHVWNWEEDEHSIFGYGIPRLARHSQSVLNTAYRMMLDNSSITAGPQIIMKQKSVRPVNGDWTLEPFKIWFGDDAIGDPRQAFNAVEFNSHQQELSGLYQLARGLFDEEVGVPMLQQGEQGQNTPTLGGMSMLMNAANTVRRRQVKQWDDAITKPLLGAFYHFNMKYHPDEAIKGDFEVEALGVKALLVRETQAQALINFFNIGAQNPIFEPVWAEKGFEVAEAFFNTQQLPPTLLPTKEQYKAFNDKKAQQETPPDPNVQAEQMRIEQQKAKHEHDMALAKERNVLDEKRFQMEFEAKMAQTKALLEQSVRDERIQLMKLQQSDKANSDKLVVELKKLEKQLQLDAAKFNEEIKIKRESGPRGNIGLE